LIVGGDHADPAGFETAEETGELAPAARLPAGDVEIGEDFDLVAGRDRRKASARRLLYLRRGGRLVRLMATLADIDEG
jgi:hypothetical protein